MSVPCSLEVEDLTVRFGGVLANDKVTLRAKPGEITALIGPNGAGKTTFINAVTGFVRFEGRVLLGDEDVSRLSADRRRRAGLARTWQAGELFDALNVVDNVRVADEGGGLASLGRDLVHSSPSLGSPANEILDLVGLGEYATTFPSDLSLGQRKLVGVARALAGAPRAVLLDEPAAGLNAVESAELGSQLKTIVANGLSMLMVDHDMSLVFGVADYVYVLDFGALIAEGTPAEVQSNEAVANAYLGSSLAVADQA